MKYQNKYRKRANMCFIRKPSSSRQIPCYRNIITCVADRHEIKYLNFPIIDDGSSRALTSLRVMFRRTRRGILPQYRYGAVPLRARVGTFVPSRSSLQQRSSLNDRRGQSVVLVRRYELTDG